MNSGLLVPTVIFRVEGNCPRGTQPCLPRLCLSGGLSQVSLGQLILWVTSRGAIVLNHLDITKENKNFASQRDFASWYASVSHKAVVEMS